ncbi:MAG: tetratricopeptide repeat protein [Acidobacteriia bacterium]|nr:tetratricopeptide repeat protein [Terriglobia bacterium]
MRRNGCLLILSLVALFGTLHAQSPSELVQVVPPQVRMQPPPANASAEELEKRGDDLRSEKAYLDALDYYRAALAKAPTARVYNKAGIAGLQLRRDKESQSDFERAVKLDREFADAWNNLGVIYYVQRKYGRAIKQYQKAIKLKQDVASFYANLGAAYYSQKEWERAAAAYGQSLQLDPDLFERSSRNGVTFQLPSPQDRAHFNYLVAKLYAKQGDRDRALLYLRRAMEEGYKAINDVYKDPEFAALRADTRFTQLMAARPPAVPE